VTLPLEYQENIANAPTSSLTKLFECMEIDYISVNKERELNLYRKYYLAWFMNLFKNLYHRVNEPNINNCVLVLTGKEQIRKTSHFRYLFPTFLRTYVSFTPHGFGSGDDMRDIAKIAQSKLVVVWDEVEQFITPQTESNFKKIIDNTPQTIIDKYEIHEKTITPIAIYGATSNQREFKLGDTGSRRMFIIPVKWIDTETMDSLCWHVIFREVLALYKLAQKKGSQPWLLTEDELQFQAHCHSKFKSKTDLDLIFEEIYDVNRPFEYDGNKIAGIKSVQTDKSGRLYTTKSVALELEKYDSSLVFKRSVLKRALERFCGRYTGTDRQAKTFIVPECRIKNGLIEQGIHKKWVLPPLTAEAQAAIYGAFDNIN